MGYVRGDWVVGETDLCLGLCFVLILRLRICSTAFLLSMPSASSARSLRSVVADRVVILCGAELGRLAAAHFVGSLEEFVQTLRVRHHPLRRFLHVCMSGRQCVRHLRPAEETVALLAHVVLPPWLLTLVRNAWSLHCTLRRCAVPRKPQPVLDAPGSHPLSRAWSRQLRQSGVFQAPAETRTSLAAGAGA